MKKKQIILIISIALILGISAFSIVKYTTVNKKAKDELNSYYSTTNEKNYPQYVIISDGVKLRLDPDASAKEVTTLKVGSIVDVIKKSDIVTKVGSKEGYWYNVKYGEKYGWVFEDFIIPKNMVSTELPQKFYNYVKGLDPSDVKSISLAMTKFKSSAAAITDKNTKDDMFRTLRNLYNNVITNASNSFTQQQTAELNQYMNNVTSKGSSLNWQKIIDNLNSDNNITDQELKDKLALLNQNGLRVETSEGTFFVAESPDYLATNTSKLVTNGLKEFLSLRSNDLKGGFAYDAGLTISWDELSDRIVNWENYTKSYSSYPEISEASNLIKKYLHTYFYGMDNSPVSNIAGDRVLIDELQKSYERFMQKYPNSSYYPIVRNYHNMLSNNNFKITNEALAYLKSNGIN